jgi:hypothetical protein
MGVAVPLARPCLGWPGPSSPSCCGLPARSRPRCCGGLAHVLFSGWLLSPLCFCSFLSGAFLVLSTCIWCKFLQNDNSSSTSGIWLVAKVYVCRNMKFYPFSTCIGGMNVSIRTTNNCRTPPRHGRTTPLHLPPFFLSFCSPYGPIKLINPLF